MLKHFYSNSKLLLTTALLASAWGGNVFADTDLYDKPFTSNGEAFGKEFNINWDKQTFEATMDLSSSENVSYNYVTLFALGDDTTDERLYVYAKSSMTGGNTVYAILSHSGDAPCTASGAHDYRYELSLGKATTLNVKMSKEKGLLINGSAFSGTVNMSDHLAFFFKKESLSFGSYAGNVTYSAGTSSRTQTLLYSNNVTYNTVKVVDIPTAPATISSALASDEVANTYFEGRQCERNDNDKFSGTANIDWATQKIVAKFDVSKCSKRGGVNPDNILSVGEDISNFSDSGAKMHFYYEKQSSGSGTATGGTGTSTPYGTLTYYYVSGKASYEKLFESTVYGNEITIEISKEKGVVANGTSLNGSKSDFATYYANLWNVSNIEIGSEEGSGRSDALINYVNVVTKAGSTTSSNTLHESNSNTFTSQNNVKVALDRTFADDGWYTLCVPFGVDAEMLKSVFGDGVELRTFGSMSGTTMNFVKSEEIEAGVPYLLKVSQDVENPTFDGVNLVAPTSDMPEAKGEDGYYMQGVYGVTEIKTDGTNLFLGGNNKFYKPTENGNKLKGMRVYFVVPEGTSTTALVANIDGTLTAIDSLEGATVVEDTTIYNLNGVAVGKDVTRLQRGIYVRGGKKFIVR